MKQAVVVLAVLLSVWAYAQSASVDVIEPVNGVEPKNDEKLVESAVGGMLKDHHRQKRGLCNMACSNGGRCVYAPGYRDSWCCSNNYAWHCN